MEDVTKDEMVRTDDKNFYRDARNWESSRIAALERSEVRAWRVATAATIAAVAAIVAVAMLTPLKSAVPFLIYVDKLTGESQVRVAMDSQTVQFSEILDKHWLSEYVISRERYYWNLLQYDYDKTNALSGPVPAREYDRQFDGPNALNKVLGTASEYSVKIISVTLSSHRPGAPGTAVVRFEKTLRRLDTEQPSIPNRYIATISYGYRTSPFTSEKTLITNPLGFTVTAYRVDPELADVTPPSAAPMNPPPGASAGVSNSLSSPRASTASTVTLPPLPSTIDPSGANAGANGRAQ